MAWYNGTHSCGHQGRVNVVGKSSEREWRINRYFEGLCEECKAKERAEKNKAAKEKSEEYDFPELIGSEKQVDWANTLRLQAYEFYSKNDVDISNMINSEKTAKFWIDNRNFGHDFIDRYNQKHEVKKEVELLLLSDSVKPTEIKHDGVVEIVEIENQICLIYERDNDFIELAKKYKYKWNGKEWYRNLSESVGTFADRAAEIGHALLENGFIICIHDEDVLNKAVSGEYEEETDEWIYSGEDTKLKIGWEGYNKKLYQKASKIKNSKWSGGYVVVDVSHYKEIERFAEENNFKFTTKAKEKIEKYKEEMENIKEVEV